MRDYKRRWESVCRLATRQYGLVTSAQLDECGFGDDRRRTMLRRGSIVRLRHGVYRLAGASRSWRASAMGAVLAAGERSALSHGTAAVIWQLSEPEDLEGRLDLTCARQLRLAGVVTHRRALRRGDVTTRFDLPVTTVERTFIDLSDDQPVGRLGAMIDDAVRRRLTTTTRLAAAVERHRRLGGPRLRHLSDGLALRGAGYDPGANDWERQMDDMWEATGLPAAERQATIVLPGGRRVRPDRAVFEVKLAVEWNGFAWHGLRCDFESDIERRNAMMRAGWTVLEFHSRQSSQEICRTVLEVYDRLCSASVSAS